MTATLETTEVVENSSIDSLITKEIDFRVELRRINTIEEDEAMKLPEHKATIRINPDGTKVPLWVVGSRYEIVDHREVIKQFSQALEKAGLEARCDHRIYKNGCRIYSFFTIKKVIEMEGEKAVVPFFTLTTSHDGSLRLGFMMGAKVGERYLNVSKTMYGAQAKHTHGINIEKTLEEVSKALSVLTDEVIPMWERMHKVVLTPEQVKRLVENAVKKKVISKRLSDDLGFTNNSSIWDVYTKVVSEVTKVPDRKGATSERAFWRNTDASEYFSKMMSKDMTSLKAIVEVEEV